MASGDKKVSAVGITTRVKVESADEAVAMELLTQLTLASAKFEGLLNAEISPAGQSDSGEWSVVQRFHSAENAASWRDSDVRKNILTTLASHLKDGSHYDETSLDECAGTVAACITSIINPGMEDDYCNWLSSVQTAQAKFPGYQGTYLQMPSNSSRLWTTILRFDTPEALEHWFVSKQRLELIEKSKQLVTSESIKRLSSSFPGWLPVDEKGNSPPRYKAAMLVLLGLYPVVMLQSKFMTPYLTSVQPPLRTFVGNVVGVAMCSFVTMPFLTAVYKDWLLPQTHSDRGKVDTFGIATIVCLYLLENILFWFFM
jgi:antibiotic biosynthesis monooxygenase (ABM) superfamily enzyme